MRRVLDDAIEGRRDGAYHSIRRSHGALASEIRRRKGLFNRLAIAEGVESSERLPIRVAVGNARSTRLSLAIHSRLRRRNRSAAVSVREGT